MPDPKRKERMLKEVHCGALYLYGNGGGVNIKGEVPGMLKRPARVTIHRPQKGGGPAY